MKIFSEMPPLAMITPASINSGIAISGKLSRPLNWLVGGVQIIGKAVIQKPALWSWSRKYDADRCADDQKDCENNKK